MAISVFKAAGWLALAGWSLVLAAFLEMMVGSFAFLTSLAFKKPLY
ncbi:hypothetical protein [uncultured Lactobacillus sp.]|nr:hypothetical protein [uncultured Lactobacillus sp.]